MSNYYCRLCLTNCSFENSFLFSQKITEMIEYCIPEFEIKLVNNPIVCGKCHILLKQTEEFKRNCLKVQESIKKCMSTNNMCDGTVNICLNNLINLETNLGRNSQPIKHNLPSFSESYKNFLMSSTESMPSNTLDDVKESKIINDKSEEAEKANSDNDEFLNLLESSRNINMEVKTNIMMSESDSCSNFYDDSTPPKLEVSQYKESKATSPPSKSVPKKVETLKTITSPLDVLIEKLCCISCELRLNNFDSLIRHLYTIHHKRGDLYTCIICRYKTQGYKCIKRHYHNVHVNCIDLKGSCMFCVADMKNNVQLHKHMRKYHSKNCTTDRFRCNSCDFTSRSYNVFRQHFFKSHDFICNYCLKSFESLECLNRHIGSHSRFAKIKFK